MIISTATALLAIDSQIGAKQDQHLCTPYLSGLVKSAPAVFVSRQLIHHSAQVSNRRFFADHEILNHLIRLLYISSSTVCD